MAKNNKNKNKNRSTTANVTNRQFFRYTASATASSNSASASITNASTTPDRWAQMCNLYRYFKPLSLRVKTFSSGVGITSCEVIPGSGTTAPAATTNMESTNMQVCSYGPPGGSVTAPVTFNNPLMDISLNGKDLQPLGEWLDVTGVGSADEEQIASIYWVTPGATDAVAYWVEFSGIFREPLEPTTAALVRRLDNSSLKRLIKEAKEKLHTTKTITPC